MEMENTKHDYGDCYLGMCWFCSETIQMKCPVSIPLAIINAWSMPSTGDVEVFSEHLVKILHRDHMLLWQESVWNVVCDVDYQRQLPGNQMKGHSCWKNRMLPEKPLIMQQILLNNRFLKNSQHLWNQRRAGLKMEIIAPNSQRTSTHGSGCQCVSTWAAWHRGTQSAMGIVQEGLLGGTGCSASPNNPAHWS